MEYAESRNDQQESLDWKRWQIAHNRLRALCVDQPHIESVPRKQLQKVWKAYSCELQELEKQPSAT
jgi:hypothetical protein